MPAAEGSKRPEMEPLSIVVTNYNGRSTLQAYLPQVVTAADAIPGSEVVLVDDASSDDSVEWLRQKMPQVRLVVHEKNTGFPDSANDGFQAATHPWVMLLSSDMVPEPGCIEHMFALLQTSEDILSISGPQIEPDGKLLCARFRGHFWRGSLRVRDHEQQPETVDGRVLHQFQNAVGLYRRENFLAVGGFCSLFTPFYFEEVDLSYRAWKLGYRILYCPEAKIRHFTDDSAICAAHKRRERRAQHRIHQYYMFWKNVNHPRWMLLHALSLLIRLPISWLWADWAFYRALAGFWKNRQEILKKRRWILAHAKLDDDQVLNFSGRSFDPGETPSL
jgi:GT2 family glycosyltransferase